MLYVLLIVMALITGSVWPIWVGLGAYLVGVVLAK